MTDDSGDPVPGVDVAVTDPTNGTQQTATTGDDGSWSVDGLDPATGYTAEITVPSDYDPSGATELRFDIDDEDLIGLDFTLTPQVESPSPTPTSASPTASPSRPAPSSPTPSNGTPGIGSETTAAATGSSDQSGDLASTGGPSLLIGLAGVALLVDGSMAVRGGEEEPSALLTEGAAAVADGPWNGWPLSCWSG